MITYYNHTHMTAVPPPAFCWIRTSPQKPNSPATAIWKFWKKTVHSGCT